VADSAPADAKSKGGHIDGLNIYALGISAPGGKDEEKVEEMGKTARTRRGGRRMRMRTANDFCRCPAYSLRL
jgi:hypothetical protein